MVTLTPLGAQFRDELAAGYAQIQAAVDHARHAAREAAGVLRIGFTVTSHGEALTRLVRAFEASNHGCQVLLDEVDSADPWAALRCGEVDVVVNWLAVNEADLTTGPAIDCRERVLAVGITHPLAKRASVSAEDLANYESVALVASLPAALTDAIVPPCTPSGRPIRRRNESVRHAIDFINEIGRGRLIHPTMAGVPLFHRGDIVLVPITGLPPLCLGLIWRTAHYNARIRALATTARAISRPGAGTRAKSRP